MRGEKTGRKGKEREMRRGKKDREEIKGRDLEGEKDNGSSGKICKKEIREWYNKQNKKQEEKT